jgi:hypothetical protein
VAGIARWFLAWVVEATERAHQVAVAGRWFLAWAADRVVPLSFVCIAGSERHLLELAHVHDAAGGTSISVRRGQASIHRIRGFPKRS